MKTKMIRMIPMTTMVEVEAEADMERGLVGRTEMIQGLLLLLPLQTTTMVGTSVLLLTAVTLTALNSVWH